MVKISDYIEKQADKDFEKISEFSYNELTSTLNNIIGYCENLGYGLYVSSLLQMNALASAFVGIAKVVIAEFPDEPETYDLINTVLKALEELKYG